MGGGGLQALEEVLTRVRRSGGVGGHEGRSVELGIDRIGVVEVRSASEHDRWQWRWLRDGVAVGEQQVGLLGISAHDKQVMVDIAERGEIADRRAGAGRERAHEQVGQAGRI